LALLRKRSDAGQLHYVLPVKFPAAAYRAATEHNVDGDGQKLVQGRVGMDHHRRRLHRGNRELRPGTHARTGANVAFCPGTFHGCALIF